MSVEVLNDVFSDYRFKASGSGDSRLQRIKRELQFPDKVQVARLAMAASLAESGRPDPAPDRDGSEIRAPTMFKKDGSGPAFAALAVVKAESPLSPAEIALELEAHWERGMKLLEDRLDALRLEGSEPDALLVEMVENSLLQEGGEEETERAGAELIEDRIVGHLAAKRTVMPLVRKALSEDPVSMGDAVLLSPGPASTGKTLFAQTIAEILRLPFVDLNGTIVNSAADLLDRIRNACLEQGTKPEQIDSRGGVPVNLFPPALVFIDECHAMPKQTQTEMLTATEPKQREAKTDLEIADLSQVTFLFATTDANKVLEPLRTRCRTISLEPYSRDEVAEIIARAHPRWPRTVPQQLAMAGRLIPRMALTQADDFDLYLTQEHPDARPSEELALRFMRERQMDQLYLVPRDYEYLAILPTDRSTKGLQAIASQMHLESDEVEQTIEPYLIQIGLAQRAASGRKITEKGIELLKAHDDSDQSA